MLNIRKIMLNIRKPTYDNIHGMLSEIFKRFAYTSDVMVLTNRPGGGLTKNLTNVILFAV